MKTLTNQFKAFLLIMFLGMSFSVGASVESDLIKDIKANPSKAAALIQAATKANPGQAASLALAVVKANIPNLSASAVSAAAARGAPTQSMAIVLAIVKEVPKEAVSVAKATVQAVPSRATAIAQAATRASPDAAVAITEQVVTVLFNLPGANAQPVANKSEVIVSSITVINNVVTTNLETKINACGTDTTCKINASKAAVTSTGTNNATLLSLLASSIVAKVLQIVGDTALANTIKTDVSQAAASAS